MSTVRGRNLATSLKRRNRPRPMERYDRLPPELRGWLAGAALPWSPHSALKLWRRLKRECQGDMAAIRRRMDLAEARMLARDAPKIWGHAYPTELIAADTRPA
ncbi:DUF6525 family protein [Pontibaca methylaminivorans]|uniref:Uncharacterized protein n=1 Tax=Pontibaca methylaminivorans TaxID=515897 RepID=A0A1R3X0Q1_9RHOB|nr:DUF6525 family protein [Pontibaca methylaminivorans]SIT84476.1 hypothetical protein SAMN05421849_2122 [Pontibaca methylaminivorans]